MAVPVEHPPGLRAVVVQAEPDLLPESRQVADPIVVPMEVCRVLVAPVVLVVVMTRKASVLPVKVRRTASVLRVLHWVRERRMVLVHRMKERRMVTLRRALH